MRRDGENFVDLALNICVKQHCMQRDKCGKTYAFHPIRVSEKMNSATEKICALLHDILEDTDYPASGIVEIFGNEIFEVVFALTRQEDEKYFDYIDRVKSNDIAIKVKLADLEDNMDPTRGWDIPESMRKRNKKARLILLNALK